MLDFAKVERGKAAYEFSEGAIGDVVTRAVEACRLRAERDRVTLDLNIADGLPTVRRDERAIEIAVINLVDNALKYAPDGRLITIAVWATKNYVEIRVTDEGAGIAADDRRRIFERFVRGKSALDKQVRGSGIGLALVKHIAEAHGGRAWVEPATPRGSSFIFTVKASAKISEAPLAIPTPRPAIGGVSPLSLAGERPGVEHHATPRPRPR